MDGKSDLPFEKPIFSINANFSRKIVDIKAWWKLAQFIKQQQPDIIQANAADTLKYTVMSKILFRWKQPIVYRNASMMSHYSKGKLSRMLYMVLLNRVSHIISVSNSAREDLCTFFGISKTKVTVIPIGLEKKEYLQLDVFKNSSPNLIHVGGFSFEKNHEGLLRIYKEILKQMPTAKLWLLGDGILKRQINEMAVRLDIAEHIHFVGVVDNPLDYIHSADLLVLPSLLEGLPAVILEAFYCKTHVVAYDVGGVKEVLTDKTGWLVPKNDEEKFALTVMNILHNRDLCDKREAGWALVNSNFLNSKISDEFEKCYGLLV
jgi:glycosyltransferase involved in cell wall biosynthesis